VRAAPWNENPVPQCAMSKNLCNWRRDELIVITHAVAWLIKNDWCSFCVRPRDPIDASVAGVCVGSYTTTTLQTSCVAADGKFPCLGDFIVPRQGVHWKRCKKGCATSFRGRKQADIKNKISTNRDSLYFLCPLRKQMLELFTLLVSKTVQTPLAEDRTLGITPSWRCWHVMMELSRTDSRWSTHWWNIHLKIQY